MKDQKDNTFKAGFVNIIGNPNAGKSTLLNALMGDKLAIVTPKSQTTRHRIKAIYNNEDCQIVFSDTPGILEPKYALQQKMMDMVQESFQDADLFLLVIDFRDKALDSHEYLQRLQKTTTPVLVLINKIDLSSNEEVNKLVEYWHKQLPKAEILPISATQGLNLDFILPKIKTFLPNHPPFYPTDQYTDKSERFVVTETIREKILLYYEQEIPYSSEVVVQQFKRNEKGILIEAEIYVERESQKGIIIGKGGDSLSKVNWEARKDLQNFFETKVKLKLFVKVQKDWRKNQRDLGKFGYS